MRKINRKCVVCEKGYTYCNSCGEDAHKPSWYNVFCSENCRKVYNAVAGVYAGQVTKCDAKSVLDTCDLSNKNHYTDATKTMIEEIYKDSFVKEKEENKEKNKNNFQKNDNVKNKKQTFKQKNKK